MIPRFIALLPLVVCACALGAAASFALAAALAAAVVTLAVIGPRWELDAGRQWLTSAMGAGAGYVAASLLHEPVSAGLREGWTHVAAAVIGAAAARALIVAPRGGEVATVALAFAALAATGQTRAHGYPWFVALFLASAVPAMRAPSLSAPRRVSFRRAVTGAAIVAVAALLVTGGTVGVHRLHAYLSSRVHSRAYSWRPRVGFSETMDLGALDGLLDSDEIVLRIRGGSVDYLRGAVLDRYESGRWVRSDESVESEASLGQPPPEMPSPLGVGMEARSDADRRAGGAAGAVEIASAGERTGRFFVPLDARDIVTSPAEVLLDELGAIKRKGKRGALDVRFHAGPRSRAAPREPRAADLHVPRRLRPTVEPFAVSWTSGASTATTQIEAIEWHLRSEYTYARAFQRTPVVDPAIDFLTRDHRGHCEYFATALALVARSAGIPARVVVGYRVGEQSPFGYDVVRERNAHAWVEAWLDGQWVTRDATPLEALPQNRRHTAGYAASAIDALRVAYEDVTSWLGGLSVAATGTAWVVGSVILAWIVVRGAQRNRARAVHHGAADEAALPPLRALLARAARAGYVHRSDESIEGFAARWAEVGAVDLLRRYSALRYGSQGDEPSLTKEVGAYTRERRSR